MLELRDPKLELVELLARRDSELADERAQARDRLLLDPSAGAADARRELRDELLEGA